MKKHVKLYNRVFEALHEDDKCVIVNNRTHEQNIERMSRAMITTIDSKLPIELWRTLAEAAYAALQSDE